MADNATEEPRTVTVDEIPIHPSLSLTGDVEPADVPKEIRLITDALAVQDLPTNPLVVLQAARWWYVHGRGTQEPVFQWAIEWTRHLATDTPPDVERYDAFLDRLVEVGFADDRRDLRSKF